MHEDRDTLIEQSQQYFYYDCSIRVYRSFCTILLAVFDAVHSFMDLAVILQENVWIFKVIIPEDHPYYSGIIADSF